MQSSFSPICPSAVFTLFKTFHYCCYFFFPFSFCCFSILDGIPSSVLSSFSGLHSFVHIMGLAVPISKDCSEHAVIWHQGQTAESHSLLQSLGNRACHSSFASIPAGRSSVILHTHYTVFMQCLSHCLALYFRWRVQQIQNFRRACVLISTSGGSWEFAVWRWFTSSEEDFRNSNQTQVG